MIEESIDIWKGMVGDRITVRMSVPKSEYIGVLVGYDGEHLIFDEKDRRFYISRHNLVFPN